MNGHLRTPSALPNGEESNTTEVRRFGYAYGQYVFPETKQAEGKYELLRRRIFEEARGIKTKARGFGAEAMRVTRATAFRGVEAEVVNKDSGFEVLAFPPSKTLVRDARGVRRKRKSQ